MPRYVAVARLDGGLEDLPHTSLTVSNLSTCRLLKNGALSQIRNES